MGLGSYCLIPLDFDAGDESNEDNVASVSYGRDYVCQVQI